MNFLPSKKFTLIVGGFLLLGVFFAVTPSVVGFFQKKQTTQKNHKTTIQITDQKDSDGDGLKDWEEALAGTNPQKPDSDNDGILDKNDLSPSQDEILKKSLTSVKDLSPTASVFNEFKKYYDSQVEPGKETEIEFSDSINNLLVDGGVGEAKKIQALKNPYSNKDITVDTSVSLKEYFNSVSRITENYFPTSPEKDKVYASELVILYGLASEIQSKGDMDKEALNAKLLKLKEFETKYLSASLDLKQMRVPQEAASIHLALTNSLANTGIALGLIQKLSFDPVAGMAGMQMYGSLITENQKTFQDIKAIFNKNKLVFDSSEPGYKFQQSYLSSKNQ